MRQLQKKIKSGTLNVKDDDPFELFIAATNIRYCYYNETHKILGNTFGMCVLQVRGSTFNSDIALVTSALSLNAAGVAFVASVVFVMMVFCISYKFNEDEITLLVEFWRDVG